jgi:diguanylate cyclase (GGDEF)-like protein
MNMRTNGRPPRERLSGNPAVQIEARRFKNRGPGDKEASERDAEARERDELAAERDHKALAHDVGADELDVNDERCDKHTLRVQELRSGAAAGRRRASASRERARRDREEAALDRELAAQDRDVAARQRRQAGTDELTGARRRGIGLEELEREVDRARRTQARLSAVFVDVDGLKAVNDAQGHGAGDRLLCEVVGGLKRHMRSYDLVVRLGGDEFLCVLPDVDPELARSHFESLNAELQNGSTKGSVSVGVGELHDGDSAQDLMDRADRDLLDGRAEDLEEPERLRPAG